MMKARDSCLSHRGQGNQATSSIPEPARATTSALTSLGLASDFLLANARSVKTQQKAI